ncbi:hypothetical protein EBZ80_15520 [bacterium]|nr:hypothetical protein [bacterium]
MAKRASGAPSWRHCKTVAEAAHLVDVGIILGWKEGRHLTATFKEDDQVAIIRYMVNRLCERSEIRLSQEIIVESLLVWLANASSESMIAVMLEELFSNPRCEVTCKNIMEVVFSAEYADKDHSVEIYNLSVVLVCELGFAIQAYDLQFPGQLKGVRQLLDRVATYLLSASNSSSDAVRLSLIHYFGETEQGVTDKVYFNRLMSRFGHTVLDHLFAMLFRKKVEAVALQFLLENMPFILEADHHTQVIVHESVKFYALKNPDRFGLFLTALAERIEGMPEDHVKLCRRALLLQFSALFRVVSEVNVRDLGRDIVIAMAHLKADPTFVQVARELEGDPHLRPQFREMVQKLLHAASANLNPAELVVLKNVKRGRKPTLARTGEMGTISQVSFLSQAAG